VPESSDKTLEDQAHAEDGLTVATRHYLASQHLWTSGYAAMSCRKLEAELNGVRPIDVEHRSFAVTAVLSAVAFLEALVNETYGDVADERHVSPRISQIDAGARQIMKEFWQATDSGQRANLLNKFQMALLFARAESFDKGAQPYQDAQLLIDLRNALVHFRPAWYESSEIDKLGLRLKARFKQSGLLTSNDGSPWFPVKALGAPGADWAFKTCKSFADEWTTRLGIPRPYEADLMSFGRLSGSNGE
jgi:hypothetical protein